MIMARALLVCNQKNLYMCLKGIKWKPKKPQTSKKCLEAKFCGCFSQVQQVNLKNKVMCTFPGYLSINTIFLKIPQADYREKRLP